MSPALTPPPWIIDYHTANDIFSGSNVTLQNCLSQMVQSGLLKYSHHEQKYFVKRTTLASVFTSVNTAKIVVCNQVATCAKAIPAIIANKKHNPQDSTPKVIAATALAGNLKILSGKPQGMYLTPLEIGQSLNVPCTSVADLCALAGIPYP